MQRGRDKAKKFRFLLNSLTRFWQILPFNIRKALYTSFRNTNGNIGFALRYSLIKTLAQHVGENVAIFPTVFITEFDKLHIGDNVSIQPFTYIDGVGGVHIGNDVSIAHGVTIMSTEHNYADYSIPIKDQGHIVKPITISDNVWIGSKATILKGVTISSGCIIAASAVVTKSIDSENGIYAGCPAKFLKLR